MSDIDWTMPAVWLMVTDAHIESAEASLRESLKQIDDVVLKRKLEAVADQVKTVRSDCRKARERILQFRETYEKEMLDKEQS